MSRVLGETLATWVGVCGLLFGSIFLFGGVHHMLEDFKVEQSHYKIEI
jgi:hypothetical protein